MYNSIKRCMMKIFDKINFREPKYMLPAVLYIPLLVASYFIFDLFQTETAEIPDKTLQTTEFLNPDLPDARTRYSFSIFARYVPFFNLVRRRICWNRKEVRHE